VPQYADELKNDADEEVRMRTDAKEKAADAIEAQKAANTVEVKGAEPPAVTWNEALPIFKKPGFQRTPEELIKLRAFNRQGGKSDPATLAKMAAFGIGVVAGINLDPDNKVEGALLGALGSVAAVQAAKAPKVVIDTVKSV